MVGWSGGGDRRGCSGGDMRGGSETAGKGAVGRAVGDRCWAGLRTRELEEVTALDQGHGRQRAWREGKRENDRRAATSDLYCSDQTTER